MPEIDTHIDSTQNPASVYYIQTSDHANLKLVTLFLMELILEIENDP